MTNIPEKSQNRMVKRRELSLDRKKARACCQAAKEILTIQNDIYFSMRHELNLRAIATQPNYFTMWADTHRSFQSDNSCCIKRNLSKHNHTNILENKFYMIMF